MDTTYPRSLNLNTYFANVVSINQIKLYFSFSTFTFSYVILLYVVRSSPRRILWNGDFHELFFFSLNSVEEILFKFSQTSNSSAVPKIFGLQVKWTRNVNLNKLLWASDLICQWRGVLLLKHDVYFFFITAREQKCTYYALRWSVNVTSECVKTFCLWGYERIVFTMWRSRYLNLFKLRSLIFIPLDTKQGTLEHWTYSGLFLM